jgi:integrase
VLLTCAKCADLPQLPVGDYALLAKCMHMPFEKRVRSLWQRTSARARALAAMDWSRTDLQREVWHVAMSWDGPTKNGKTLTQALLPRSLRALRVWHRLAGSPDNPGDVRFFYHAGHGSQVPNSLSSEADELDKSLVPSDGNDIRDKELRRLYTPSSTIT